MKANTLISTRYHCAENDVRLFYMHITGTNVRSGKPNREVSFWQHLVQDGKDEPAQVGPQYPTKEALLADQHRYATEYGFH